MTWHRSRAERKGRFLGNTAAGVCTGAVLCAAQQSTYQHRHDDLLLVNEAALKHMSMGEQVSPQACMVGGCAACALRLCRGRVHEKKDRIVDDTVTGRVLVYHVLHSRPRACE